MNHPGQGAVLRLRRRVTGWWERFAWFRFISSGITLFAQRRVFGLSAEAAFWATFTLPWLVLGLVAATSGVASWLGEDVAQQVSDSIVSAASRVLTPEAIDQTLMPLLESVQQGSAGLTVLGLAVALWSGSRVFATFVVGSEILNGRQLTGYVRTRAVALGIYALALLGLGIVVVTIVKFPEFWGTLLGLVPGPTSVWAVVLIGIALILALTTLLFLADGDRSSWTLHLPGGVLTLVVWVIASWGLSLYLRWSVASVSLYGAIAAPIAVMLWVFISVLALFVGMTLTAALRLAGDGEYLDPFDLGSTVSDPPEGDSVADDPVVGPATGGSRSDG